MKLGIQENKSQFLLLVMLNAFVGSMVGLERTIMPVLGEQYFVIASATAALSFIVSFGFSKAITNYFAGQLSDMFGRKKVLVTGWSFGLIVPIILLTADVWTAVVMANIFLGINQGLAWSMTVNMKIDIAKGSERGTAVGLNEFAGYSGVAIMAVVSGYIATVHSVFYIGIIVAFLGFIIALFVKDTDDYLQLHIANSSVNARNTMTKKEIFIITTFRNKFLSSYTFAGFATNFKDGMIWGLLPIFLLSKNLSLEEIGIVVAVYPASWGIFQIITGFASDKYGRKMFLVTGMILQASALWMLLFVDTLTLWILSAVLLGIGTAMVYPVLQAAIGDVTAPSWRASAMGVYRFWRDSGYAFGALLAGVIADVLSVSYAIGLVAVIPFVAGWIILIKSKSIKST